MGPSSKAQRVGRPQIFAGLLLLALLVQCLWLVQREAHAGVAEPAEIARLADGLQQWRGSSGSIAGSHLDKEARPDQGFSDRVASNDGWDANHSPLAYLLYSAPLLVWPVPLTAESFAGWVCLARIPSLLFGLLLGASLWYVARRLYGDSGGYVALTLHCFSPGIISSSAQYFSHPEIGAAWGTFGGVFTAIAVAHTLYAPREVVLWNWRRILLLGLALALGIGSQFSLLILAPIALGFMLYLAPGKRKQAVIIWLAACGVALLIIFAAYSFRPGRFWGGMRHADFFGLSLPALTMLSAYTRVLERLAQGSPALVLLLPVTLAVYAAWPRTRYFGNTTPLVTGLLCLLFGFASPHYPGLGFQLVALPFLFVFVAGISADLLETSRRNLVWMVLWGTLIGYSLWNVLELAKLGRG